MVDLVVIHDNLNAQDFVDQFLHRVVPLYKQNPGCLMHDNTRLLYILLYLQGIISLDITLMS